VTKLDVRIGLSGGHFMHFSKAEITYIPDVGKPRYVDIAIALVPMPIRVDYHNIEYIVPLWTRTALRKSFNKEGG